MLTRLSRPKVVNAASASLNIDETIRQGILVFGGKRLSEQDKYSLELKALKETDCETFVKEAPDELKSNKEFMLKAVCIQYLILKYASEELQDDEEVVLEAVKQNGYALRYASEELKSDHAFMLEAVRQNGDALLFASALQNDREVVEAAQ